MNKILLLLLLFGISMIILGFINMNKISTEKKIIYKYLPRNVYDEIFFSLPLSQYDKKIYDNMNPEYVLEDENNYNTLSKVI